MITGPAAVKRCGMLGPHAGVFASVAATNNAVIASRELNPLSEGLIREGYASKGFHIKAKSCNWGPMAGFVCADPRFSKATDLPKQRGCVERALNKGARLVHIQISSQRLIELDSLGVIRQDKQGIAAQRILIHSNRQRPDIAFVAVREGNAEPIWKLYYLKQACDDVTDIPANLDASNSEKVFGLSNVTVPTAGAQPGGPHAAVAGDYDLFCVWPRFWQQRPIVAPPRALDHNRFAARDAYIQAVQRAGYTGPEHPDMGNISFYVIHIVQQLNAGIGGTGYTGGNMVHHNDEATNPHTPGQDFPILFFFPNEEPCAIENVHELVRMFDRCQAAGYAVERNLGFNLRTF